MSKTSKKISTILITGAVVVLSYCSSEFYIPSQQQISTSQNKWPEADSSYLFSGYDLYRKNAVVAIIYTGLINTLLTNGTTSYRK